MQQHRPCLFLEITDPTLGDPILPVRIFTAVGYPLVFLIQALPPCVVHKATIVGMVVLHLNTSLPCIKLEGVLCLQSFLGH
jgi:hypothetical protein